MVANVEKLEELFNDISEITPEKMELLVKESIKAFEQIVSQLNSPDEEKRKEAQSTAEKLRDTLEKQSMKALEAVNMSAKELEAFTTNKDNFNPEEWEALQKARKELESYQKDMTGKGIEEPAVQKKKKPLWIPS